MVRGDAAPPGAFESSSGTLFAVRLSAGRRKRGHHPLFRRPVKDSLQDAVK